MSETSEDAVPRAAAGRWLPGQSGNPAGKAPGTRNRATLLHELLDEGEDRVIARVVVDKAKAGDAVAARFVIGHLCPRPRARTIEIELAEGEPAHNVVAAHGAVLRALFAGEIAPDEAEAVTRVLDARMRAMKAWGQKEYMMRCIPGLPGDGPAAGGGPSGIRCPGSRRRQRSGRFVLLHFACKRRTGSGHPERAARRAGSWRRFIEASGRSAGSPAFRLHRHARDTRKSSAGHAGASGIGSGASCGARPADARPPTGIAGKRRRFALIAMPAPTQHADLRSPIEGGKRGQGTL
jgi:hypothetical protein